MDHNQNSTPHLSKSARELTRLKGELAQYQLMAQEFGVILNYMIVKHGDHDTLIIDREFLLRLEIQPVKTEFIKSPVTNKVTGQRYTRFKSETTAPKSLIILP
jgi:hypothetical protein